MAQFTPTSARVASDIDYGEIFEEFAGRLGQLMESIEVRWQPARSVVVSRCLS